MIDTEKHFAFTPPTFVQIGVPFFRLDEIVAWDDAVHGWAKGVVYLRHGQALHVALDAEAIAKEIRRAYEPA